MRLSPAAEAGIEPGDQIISIEGRSTRTMSIDEAVQIMRGETGCPVVFDATHSVQQPGGQGTSSGGKREFEIVEVRYI